MIINPTMRHLKPEGAFAIMAHAEALRAQGQSVINLGIGQPDFAPPPHVIDATRRALKDGPHGYTPTTGVCQLREAVAADVTNRTGAPISPEQVVITPGGKPVFFQATQLLGGVGREILYPDPGFLPYSQAISVSGAIGVPYPVTSRCNFAVQATDILERLTHRTGLIILNSPSNPTGGITPLSQLSALAEGLAQWPDVMILSDEIYGRQLYTEPHASPLSIESLRNRTILLDGWSKAWAMTGWRLGFGVWPQNLIQTVSRLIMTDYSCVNVAAQAGALAALTGPQDYAESMMSTFKMRRETVVKRLNGMTSYQAGQVSCHFPGGAFYAFPDISASGWSSRALAKALLEKVGVAVCPGDDFGENGSGFLRLSFAASTSDIEIALNRIQAFLAETPQKTYV